MKDERREMTKKNVSGKRLSISSTVQNLPSLPSEKHHLNTLTSYALPNAIQNTPIQFLSKMSSASCEEGSRLLVLVKCGDVSQKQPPPVIKLCLAIFLEKRENKLLNHSMVADYPAKVFQPHAFAKQKVRRRMRKNCPAEHPRRLISPRAIDGLAMLPPETLCFAIHLNTFEWLLSVSRALRR